MGRKHKHAAKRAGKAEALHAAAQHTPDPSVACLALHPQGQFVAIAVHDVVRISNRK